MKKSYAIEVDCAHCAAKMEEAANKVEGVNKVTVNFLAAKMIVDFKEEASETAVMKEILKVCRKVEPDCEIEF